MITTFCVLALFAVVPTSVKGHSHLANPLPTRRLDCRVGNGRARACYGPCPPLDTYGELTGISASNPAETWRRGDKRTVSWHRNNHGDGESGFVRLSLVPVDQMMDKRAHEKFTFQISCWSSGLHWCPSRQERVCGNDGEGKAYKVPIIVPASYPDGVYAFGWAWYGGGDYRGASFFGDYFSCSFIRIAGGAEVTQSYRPVFVPGIQQKYSDACVAATDRVGHCVREPCRIGQVRPLRPKNLPSSINSRDLGSQELSGSGGIDNGGQPEKDDLSPGKRGSRLPFRIEGLQVFDLRTNQVKTTSNRKVRIRLSGYKEGFTLGLQVSGNVDKVRFDMPGYDHTERMFPFIVNGNVDGELDPLQCRKGKVLTISCTVFGPGDATEKVEYKVKCI